MIDWRLCLRAQPGTDPHNRRTAWLESTRSSIRNISRREIDDLAKAPVEALIGLSEGDAQKLKNFLNVQTVKDPGTNKFFLWAYAVAKLARIGFPPATAGIGVLSTSLGPDAPSGTRFATFARPEMDAPR